MTKRLFILLCGFAAFVVCCVYSVKAGDAAKIVCTILAGLILSFIVLLLVAKMTPGQLLVCLEPCHPKYFVL
jgi:hypothetical protein